MLSGGALASCATHPGERAADNSASEVEPSGPVVGPDSTGLCVGVCCVDPDAAVATLVGTGSAGCCVGVEDSCLTAVTVGAARVGWVVAAGVGPTGSPVSHAASNSNDRASAVALNFFIMCIL